MMLGRITTLLVCSCVALGAWSNEAVQRTNEGFSEYQQRLRAHLEGHKVWVDESNKVVELDAVMPFQRQPSDDCNESESIGLLLFHGLSDSPFSLRDPAQALAERCIATRVMLLPGHGTKAEDLLDVSRESWRAAVAQAVQSFSQEVDSLYLGGFSTGGALVTEYAWQHPDDIAGVVLFSPLFKINSSIDWLSPWLAPFVDWLDHYPSDDYGKYASIPVPAIAEAYKLAKEVMHTVTEQQRTIPVFVALSEEDATVDSSVTMQVFDQAMKSTLGSQMVLYSTSRANTQTESMKIVNTDLPEQKIFGLSHMAIHGAPDNPYYGRMGSYRVCGWYQGEPDIYNECRRAENNWYGEQGELLTSKSAYAGRLSWNPYFDDLMDQVSIFMHSVQAP